jgi:hypothetical protein
MRTERLAVAVAVVAAETAVPAPALRALPPRRCRPK